MENKTNKTAYQILRGNCKYFDLGITEDEAVRSMNEFSTQQSKEKDERIHVLEQELSYIKSVMGEARIQSDEEIKRLKQLKLEHELFIGKASEVLGFNKTMELLKESKDAFK